MVLRHHADLLMLSPPVYSAHCDQDGQRRKAQKYEGQTPTLELRLRAGRHLEQPLATDADIFPGTSPRAELEAIRAGLVEAGNEGRLEVSGESAEHVRRERLTTAGAGRSLCNHDGLPCQHRRQALVVSARPGLASPLLAALSTHQVSVPSGSVAGSGLTSPSMTGANLNDSGRSASPELASAPSSAAGRAASGRAASRFAAASRSSSATGLKSELYELLKTRVKRNLGRSRSFSRSGTFTCPAPDEDACSRSVRDKIALTERGARGDAPCRGRRCHLPDRRPCPNRHTDLPAPDRQ